MAKILDRTGVRYGKLVAVREDGRDEKGGATWLCRCDCGADVVVAPLVFTRKLPNCGCTASGRASSDIRLDRAGERYGSLTAVRPLPAKKTKNTWRGGKSRPWLMVCDCGTEVITNRFSGKHRQHCGCQFADGESKSQIKNRVGERHGHVVAIRYDRESGRGRGRWICRCDCGREVSIRTTHFGRNNLSCGCFKRNKYGLLPGEWIVVQSIRKGATERGLPFELSPRDVADIVARDCVYCGAPPRLRYKTHKGYLTEIKANGIDRIDSALGYVQGNVQPCCKSCNVAKLDRSDADFRAWVLKVADHIRGNS